MGDRQVHARLANGDAVVRYDRSGKWYVEHDTAPRAGRRLITLAEAVSLAADPAAARYWRRPGGRLFDVRLTRMLEGER